MPEHDYIGKIYLLRGEKCYRHPEPDPNTGDSVVLNPIDDVAKIWEGINMEELRRLEDAGKIAIRLEDDDEPVENRAQDLPGEYSSRIGRGKKINIDKLSKMTQEEMEEFREEYLNDENKVEYDPDTVPREDDVVADTNYGLDVEVDEEADKKNQVDYN